MDLIAELLKSQKKHVSFHTPGHKRAGGDITELSYSDNLYAPHGVLAQAERELAAIVGAKSSFLLTDGSTSGIFSMLYALREGGGSSFAAPVYSHPSVFHAAKALGLNVIPLGQSARYGIPLPPAEEEIARALAGADALLVTSPDYYGTIPPLARWKELCKGKPFLIDGAHGSHLHVTPTLYAGGYADLWVDGVHKSLPALTQGALVSAKTETWAKLLSEGVRTFRTTSPSYPILASVEHAVKFPRNEKIERAAAEFKQTFSCVKNDDWTKLLVPFGENCDSAQAFLEAHGVYAEFNDGNYLMFYLSPCTTERELKKLGRLLKKLPRGSIGADAPVGAIPIYSEGV